MEENFDREYYIAALCENLPYEDMSDEIYFSSLNDAIDKTICDYRKDGSLFVEDWDMFDQDLYNNAYKILESRS